MKTIGAVIDTTTTVVTSEDQVSCDLDGEAAILNLTNSIYYGLDIVGARIWTLLKDPMTVGAIRDCLVREFEVDPAACERDLIDFLGRLAAEGLITTGPVQSR